MPIRARVCAEDDRTHPSRHGRAAGAPPCRRPARPPCVQEGCGSLWARAPTHSPCFPGAQVSVKAVQKTGRSGMGTWRNAMVALGLANEVDDEYYEDERDGYADVAAPARRTERASEPAPERERSEERRVGNE